jgi:hypothetical protein
MVENRCRGVGYATAFGCREEAMKRLLVIFVALAAGALLGIGALVPAAVAEQGQELLLDVFKDDDTVDPTPGAFQRLADAVRNTQRPDRCPLGELKIVQPRGDPSFYPHLAAARRDTLLAQLDRRGLNVAGRLFTVIDDQSRLGKFDATFTAARDDKPPILRTTSNPPKGSKVDPRQRIVVRMAARDDADRWQTGIKTVRLVADSDGGRDVAPTPIHYDACSDPNEKRVEATYVVPPNPPPIVRLTATAMDHVNLTDKDVGEFPTGEWYGRMTWTHVVANSRGTATTTANADLALNPDRSGGLTGRLVGSHTVVAQHGCSSRTATAATIEANLVGSYTPGRDAMAIRASDKRTTPMQIEVLCPGAPPRVTSHHADYYEFYERALRGLRPTADGGFSSSDDQERPCEGGTCTTRISLTLRRASN